MGNIIVALLVGGFATIVLMWPHGVFIALCSAPIGASLLALIVAVGNWLLRHPSFSPRRARKDVREFDRQEN